MTVQPTFVATLIDEWVRAGVRHAVISPGSRSSALTIALASEDRLTIHMRLDERSGAFFALGLARSSMTPVVVVTTSGTAAPELHAAVVEADLTGVPLIVATTDRPIELHEVGASQTINQVGLFGSSTRLAVDFGVPEAATEHLWRSMASQLVVAAMSSSKGPGPVQANLAFREPFVGVPVGPLPQGRLDGAPWHQGHVATALGNDDVAFLCSLLTGRKGIIVAGDGAASGDHDAIVALADLLSWPVIADPRAFPRKVDDRVIAFADGIFRSQRARSELRPDVVLRLGDAHLSKAFATFVASLRASDVLDISVTAYGRISDPDRMAHHLFAGEPATIARQCVVYLSENERPTVNDEVIALRRRFKELDIVVGDSIEQSLSQHNAVCEPQILRDVFANVPDNSMVVVSASMPVRDLEWFAAPRDAAPQIIFNGGANGIDGSISTVLGVAVGTTAQVTAVIGDLSFFHDLSGLVWGTHEVVPKATIVVIDNRGGGIFSFLDQARVLDKQTYERTMGTPQRSDPAQVAASLGCNVFELDGTSIAELLTASYQKDGISIIVVRTDRDENRSLHGEIEQAVCDAVDAALTKL